MEELAEQVELHLPHHQQSYDWDCGLACAHMVLKYLGIPHSDFVSVCKNLQFGESVWTIDLAHIMVHYGIRHHMCTVTLGVNSDYSNKTFYKSHFDTDEVRVNNLFKTAKQHGISVEKRSLEIEELFKAISQGHIIIMLVDWSFLTCKWCSHRCLPTGLCCMSKCIVPYQGHFIVLCGYNLKEKIVYYKNPAHKEELCCCSIRTLEQARRSHGTDEDALFIYKSSEPQQKVLSDFSHSTKL